MSIFTYIKRAISDIKDFFFGLRSILFPKEKVVVFEEEMSEQSAILLEEKDFAIVFRETRVEAIVPTHFDDPDFFKTEEGETHLEHVENTIAYVMHALLREDWQEEYYDAVEEYAKTLPTESEIEALRRRSEFKLIINEEDEPKE